MDEIRKSTVCETGDGITYCGNCRQMLFSNDCGDMPDFCPACGMGLDYSMYDQHQEDSAAKPEPDSAAVTNIAIVEDGNGKIHIFKKTLDERETWTAEAFQREVQSWADQLNGSILAIFRERDVIGRCSL